MSFHIPVDLDKELKVTVDSGELPAVFGGHWGGRAHYDLPSGWSLVAPEKVNLNRVRPEEPDHGAWNINGTPVYRVNRIGESPHEWCVPGNADLGRPVWTDWSGLWEMFGGPHVTIRKMAAQA